jgi:hypothetical protein
MFISGVVYHCIATGYGVWIMLWGVKSNCVELEMFKKITCFIYLLWVTVIIVFLVFNMYKERLKTRINNLNQNLMEL